MESAQAKAFRLLQETLAATKAAKPNDRGVQDRAFAIVITDLEKVVSYYEYWIIKNGRTT